MQKCVVTVRDQRPIGDWFEQGLLAEDVQLSPEGQALIRDFGKDKFGAPLFFPDVIR